MVSPGDHSPLHVQECHSSTSKIDAAHQPVHVKAPGGVEALTMRARSFPDLFSTEQNNEELNVAFMNDACVIHTPFRQADRSLSRPSSGRDSPVEWNDCSSSRSSSQMLWTALQLLRWQSTQCQLESFMSYVITACAVDGECQSQLKKSDCAAPSTPRTGASTPRTPSERTQAGRNEVCKTFLNLNGRHRNDDALWSDEHMSRIQGTFFRACTRPPCLQDRQLSILQFQYVIDKTARFSLLIAIVVLHFYSNLAMSSFLPSFPFLKACAMTVGLPFGLIAVANHVDILHCWLAGLVVLRWLILAAMHALHDVDHDPMVAFELGPVVTTVAAAALMELQSHRCRVRAAEASKEDRDAYDKVWEKVLEDGEETRALEQVVRLCCHHSSLPPALQRVMVSAPSVPRSLDPRPVVRVKSVDQLHQQSMLLQPLLRARAQWWALQSRGWFKTKCEGAEDTEGGAGFAKWKNVHGNASAAEGIAWGCSKSYARSSEKVALLYKYDVSRLCDVTRETIWFDSIQDLNTCLTEVAWDRWTVIVGVKNSLDKSVQSQSTGGFRFVKLLLRLETPEAKEIGLDGHVCELLLTLKAMEASKSEGWHARYRQWRHHRPADFVQRMHSTWEWMEWIMDHPRQQVLAARERRKSVKAEELARVASQTCAEEEMARRRLTLNRGNARFGKEREAMLKECMEAMKDYLWGTNSELYGKIGARAENIQDATTNASFAACFRMKQPIPSLLCRGVAQAIFFCVGLLLASRSAAGCPQRQLRLSAERYESLLPLGGLLVGLGMALSALCGHLHKPQLGSRTIELAVSVSLLPNLLAAGLLAADGRAAEAAVVASWAASTVWWLLLTWQWPALVLEAVMGSALITMAGTLLAQRPLPGMDGLWVGVDPVAVLCLAIVIACKALVLLNDRSVEAAYRRDIEVYSHVWEKISMQDRGEGVLDRLKECTDQMGAAGEVTQRSLPWHHSLDHDQDTQDPSWWGTCSLSESAQLHALSPSTQSIDQLYAQAEVAAVVLRHKLKLLAVASRGLFLRRQAGWAQRRQWARAAELLSGEADDIFWGPLKKEARALEKAHRCYGGDVSKLLDLSRHSIVFEDPAHILECLALLRRDPDIKVVRVKNDLHASRPSPSGYRHVLVNVMVVTEETQRMGVSMHISELQLVPLGYALAKTDEGHRRYVCMRNARGE